MESLKHNKTCPLCKKMLNKRSLRENLQLRRISETFKSLDSIFSAGTAHLPSQSPVKYRHSPELKLSQLYPNPSKRPKVDERVRRLSKRNRARTVENASARETDQPIRENGRNHELRVVHR